MAPRKQLPEMTADEFRAALKALGWTYADAAEQFGLCHGTVAGYANGARIPLTRAKLLRLWLAETREPQTFRLSIKTANAAFADHGLASELARILRELALRIERDDHTSSNSGKLYDLNGNRVGEFEYVGE